MGPVSVQGKEAQLSAPVSESGGATESVWVAGSESALAGLTLAPSSTPTHHRPA